MERDDYNRPLPPEEQWMEECECRCDDESVSRIETEDGRVFRPTHHIVCPSGISVREDDYIKVYDGDRLRGEGKVVRVKRLNKLKYTEIWV